jgi:hypothetical protein
MKLNTVSKPKVRSIVGGGFRIVVLLEGEESSVWKLDYDTAAKEVGVAARSINDLPPWGIALFVDGPEQIQDRIEAAVEVLEAANRAYSERLRSRAEIDRKANEWWSWASQDSRPPAPKWT